MQKRCPHRSHPDRAGHSGVPKPMSRSPRKSQESRARVGRLVVEASLPSPIELGDADEWRILLLLHGIPIDYLRLPSPGYTIGDARVEDVVLRRRAHSQLAYQNFIDRLRQRLGAPRPHPKEQTCSVIVCTHRRSSYLPDLLGALSKLEPSADEIIVVDNDPGDSDCRFEVEAAGATYLREDRGGLDHARNAGLSRARCDLVAFTDDDCVPAPGWLARLPELFDDPAVGAVTGPAFAYKLETSSQVRFEDSGGFRRGMNSRVWDWTSLPPPAAGRAGAGANMIFRRDLLVELGEVFPPELDAGTPTQSGGDMYALYKVLRSGRRVVYDPGTYVFHQHRRDLEALRKAFWGYGVGLSATLTKLLVEERELGAVASWLWLWRQFMHALGARALGSADSTDLQNAWDYLRGGFAGPVLWRRALKQACAVPAPPPNAAPVIGIAQDPYHASRATTLSETEQAPKHGPPAAAMSQPAPAVSVVIPTTDRPDSLRRCLEALTLQAKGAPSFEVVVVDDGRSSLPLAPMPTKGLNVRWMKTGGNGAGAARNAGAGAARGGVLLFLDDDLVPSPDLLAMHLRRHVAVGRERVVIGYSPPRPSSPTLASLAASLWWEDHFRAKKASVALTFTHVLSGNASVSKAAFERVGGFDEALGRFRREDWEWGIRALSDGLEAVYEPRAVAAHEFTLKTRQLLDGAYREGRGDSILLGRFPFAAASLPFARPKLRRGFGQPVRKLAAAVLSYPPAVPFVVRGLDALEWINARHLWVDGMSAARRACYLRGFEDGGQRGSGERSSSRILSVELNSEMPINAPTVAAPEIELRVKGPIACRFNPSEGSWDGSVAVQAAHMLAGRWWSRLDLVPPDIADKPDLCGVAVVLGPARLVSDELQAGPLRAAGAEVHLVDGADGNHWPVIDEAVRACSEWVVAVPLPGARLEPYGLAYALSALEGDRTAAAAVWGLPPEDVSPSAVLLASRRTHPRPYTFSTRAAHCLLVRKEAFEKVGGFRAWTGLLAPHGPAAELLERLLDAGYVVASCAIPGIDIATRSPAAIAGREGPLARVRGGLTARRAASMGIAPGALFYARHGLIPLLRTAYRGIRHPKRSRQSLREAAHLVIGSLIGWREAARESPELADHLPFSHQMPDEREAQRMNHRMQGPDS